MSYDLNDEATFKGWALKRHKAASLLKEIIFRWRACTIPVKGKAGPWAVYPMPRWAGWFGASTRTTERLMKELEDEGLILKAYHTFAGPGVHVYLQPTALALKHYGKPSDFKRLGHKIGGEVGGEVGGVFGGDNTSLSSLPSSLSKHPGNCAKSNFSTEKVRPKTKKKIDSGEAAEPAPVVGKEKYSTLKKFDPQSPEGKLAAKVKTITTNKKLAKDTKLAQLLKLLPEHPGAVKVKHPSELHPKWHTWSPELLVLKQKLYEEFVANELKGKGSKSKVISAVKKIEDEEFMKEFEANYTQGKDEQLTAWNDKQLVETKPHSLVLIQGGVKSTTAANTKPEKITSQNDDLEEMAKQAAILGIKWEPDLKTVKK
jgi:hypothetical protein